jgi:ABC-type sugar transport system permease subunit
MRYSSRITVFYAFSVAFFVVAIATLLAAAVSANVRGHKAMKIIWFFPGIAPPTRLVMGKPQLGVHFRPPRRLGKRLITRGA